MMNRMVMAMVCLGALAVGAQAAIIAQDDFNSYSDGALAGQGGWTKAFGTANNVASGVVDAQGSGADYLSLPAALGDSGTVWFSIDFGTTTDQSTWAGLSFFAPTAGASRTERVLIGDRSGADVWGIAMPSGNYNNSSVSTLGMKTGVGRITLGTGTTSSIDLWVGADAVAAVNVSGVADATLSGLELYDVDKIRLGAGADSYLFDNVIFGDTYQDVGAIPEPATLGLIGVCGGGLLFARRRFML